MSRFNLVSRRPFRVAALCALAAWCGACANPPAAPTFCVTIAPLEMIIGEIAQGGPEVVMLLPPGASPHTYELTPSGARAAANALGVFSVSESLDAWAGQSGSRASIEVLSLLPPELLQQYASNAGDIPDPHFWMDPLAVRDLLPAIASKLAEMDPPNAEAFTHNAAEFTERLETLDLKLTELLRPIRGAGIVQHHPSMNYFFARYGLRSIGAIEPAPGQEPTPRDLQRLADAMREHGVRVLVTEPQLPRAPVDALAEMTGARVVELDPIGGVPGRDTYEALLRFNAHALLEALQ